MIFQYFSDSDMLYIKLGANTSSESEEVVPGIVLDFDDFGKIVGIEIEDAASCVDLSRLEILSLPMENVVIGSRPQQSLGHPSRNVPAN
jgi:uncharacterized protein YuzE